MKIFYSNETSPFCKPTLFMIQKRQRKLITILGKYFNWTNISNQKLLEIGCGNGQWLSEFVFMGFIPELLAGIDIDEERVKMSNAKIPNADIRIGDAARLPWEDERFDIVFQSTVFTSIKDNSIKRRIANEMIRVCRSDGIIIWYDFIYDNYKNSNVKGIGKSELNELFNGCGIEIFSVTLAPPIARLIIPFSWIIGEILEELIPLLRTHIFAVIKPKQN